MDPKEKYDKKVESLLTARDKLTDRQVKAVFKVLADTRRRIVDELSQLAGQQDSFQAYQLGQLRSAIDSQAAELITKYRPIMGGAVEKAWDWGAEFEPALLKAAGVDLQLRAISRAQLAVAQEVSADLVVKVGDDFRARAKGIITRGVVGELSPHLLMRNVGDLLRTQPDRQTGKLGNIAFQSERIIRTELASVSSLSNRLRHEQIAQAAPDVRKYWLHSGARHPRPDHLAAAARYAPGGIPGPIKQNEDYQVGGHTATGPHDPRLPADQVVNCFCMSLLWSKSWFEPEAKPEPTQPPEVVT